MSRRKIKAGSTSQILPVFIQDTSSTTGAGLGSLVYNTASLAAKYRRQGDSSWTAITLVTATAGTFTSGGFVADGGSVTGGYELGLPNAMLASGATWAQLQIYGAANMLSVLVEFELDAINYQDATRAGLAALPNVASGSAGGLIIQGTGTTGLNVSSGKVLLQATQTGVTIPNVTTVTNLTNAPTNGDFTATMKTSITTAATAATPSVTVSDKTGFKLASDGLGLVTTWTVGITGNITGNVSGSIGSVATGGITSTSFAAGAIDAAAIATDAIGSNEISAAAVTKIQSGLMLASSYTAPLDATGIRNAVGLASANLDAQLDAIPTATENSTQFQADLMAYEVEPGVLFIGAIRLGIAADSGITAKSGNTFTLRNAADTKDRITATVDDAGLRSAVTRDLT